MRDVRPQCRCQGRGGGTLRPNGGEKQSATTHPMGAILPATAISTSWLCNTRAPDALPSLCRAPLRKESPVQWSSDNQKRLAGFAIRLDPSVGVLEWSE